MDISNVVILLGGVAMFLFGMSLMGQTETGSYVYKYVITKVNEAPQYLIISKNGGNNKIYDGIAFVNHGYYVEGQTTPAKVISATGIATPLAARVFDTTVYTLDGRKVYGKPLRKGVYIRNGRKFVVR